MRLISILASFLALASCGLQPASAAPARVGINLGNVSYYDRTYPFIDRMKSAGDWHYDGDWNSPVAELDARGYPLPALAGRGLQITVGTDFPEAGTPRRYVLTWSGDPDMSLGTPSGRVVERSANRAVIEPLPNLTSLDLRLGFHPGTTIAGLHMVREDQEALFRQGRTFNPVFLARVAPFDTLRMMDWGRTNSATVPAGRAGVGNLTWAGNEGGGIPLEVMIQLCNELGRNLWYNLPFQATDEQVAAAVRTIRTNLRSDLIVYVEWSNEVWNWQFPGTTLASQAGQPLGLDVFTYHGFRAAQVAKVVRAAWGPDKRLRNVLATQTGWLGQEQYHIIPGVQRVGDPAALFDAYAVTTYFGDSFGATEGEDRTTLVGWANGGDAGLAAAFRELEQGGTLKNDTSLRKLAATLAYQKGVADRYGWELVAYEGGAHTTGYPSGNAADDQAMGALVGRLIVDPRMGALYARMVDTFSAAGGTMLASYTEAGPFWGALPDIYAEHSPRYDALVAAAKAGAAKAATPAELVAARLADGRIYPAGELIAAGWPAGAPANAATTLSRTILPALRKTTPIESVTGYRLTPTP